MHNSDTVIASLSRATHITTEVGAYRAGYRALYSEVLTEHKHSFVFNLNLFYFDIPMPMFTVSSETHSARIVHFRTWMICELSPDIIDYCSAIVWLYASHITYEIVHHHSPLVMTMYIYVH